MDEMENINLHKTCNKKAPEPKKAPMSTEFIDDLSGEEQKPKKADRKRPLQRQKKKFTGEKSTKIT